MEGRGLVFRWTEKVKLAVGFFHLNIVSKGLVIECFWSGLGFWVFWVDCLGSMFWVCCGIRVGGISLSLKIAEELLYQTHQFNYQYFALHLHNFYTTHQSAYSDHKQTP